MFGVRVELDLARYRYYTITTLSRDFKRGFARLSRYVFFNFFIKLCKAKAKAKAKP